MPATRKVKVRCHERRVCGWSGERADIGPFGDPTDKPCPRCLRRSVELMGSHQPQPPGGPTMTRSGLADGWVRAGEAAELLGVARETLTRWARAGKLPHQRTLGGHRIYAEAELRALLEANTVQPSDADMRRWPQ